MSLLEQLRRFPVSLIADGLDQLGFHEQVIRPPLHTVCRAPGGRFAGTARTLSFRALPPEKRFGPVNDARRMAYIQELEQLIRPGDVVVIGWDGPPPECAIMGDLYAALYRNLGAVGFLTEGFVRDHEQLAAIGLGVIAAGTLPCECRGRVLPYASAAPVAVTGVAVVSGESVVASDDDGTVIVPAAALTDELIAWMDQGQAAEHAAAEHMRAGGMLSEAFARFGKV